MKISDFTPTNLQEDILGPYIIKEYREHVSKRMKNGEYMCNSAIYNSSTFQDFNSSLRREIALVEDDNRLVLDEYNSSFIIYELEPGIYTVRDLSEAIFNILQPEY